MNRIVRNIDDGTFSLKRETADGLGVDKTLGVFKTEREARLARREPISEQRYASGKSARENYEAWLMASSRS